MNQEITVLLRKIISDHVFASLIGLLVILTLVFCAYVAFTIQPSDLQLAVRYTAFGETNYYRDRWFYLLSFIGFGLVSAIINVGLSIKVFILEKRSLALATLGCGFIMLFITAVVTRSVLSVALL